MFIAASGILTTHAGALGTYLGLLRVLQGAVAQGKAAQLHIAFLSAPATQSIERPGSTGQCKCSRSGLADGRPGAGGAPMQPVTDRCTQQAAAHPCGAAGCRTSRFRSLQ